MAQGQPTHAIMDTCIAVPRRYKEFFLLSQVTALKDAVRDVACESCSR